MVNNIELSFLSRLGFSMILFSLILVPNIVLANPDIQFYRIDVKLHDNDVSEVQLVFNFEEPEDHFSMNVIGRVDDFNATSNAGPVDCQVTISGTSSIECDMNLTGTRKELQMNFKTKDFVKSLDDKFYFSADLSPHIRVKEVSATLRLPEGAFLTGEDISSSILSYSENASAHIVSDNIIVVWTLRDILSSGSVKFEVLYENVEPPLWFGLRMRHFILLGGSFAAVLGVIIFYYLRRSKNVVLSVLDEYERKVMDIITKEGEVKQKHVVQQTNLSKAKVSRVVKSLVGRGLVESERRGRTNRLRAVKTKLKT